eukprot:TRINITY_DN2922_c1_g1_i2.p5 TRINITY_DN2922_c1_g1~~TRINITY_DN2922_c1_g1_i2.p5  ORF type:complete len:101 (-),score=26.45 TRINITY_DN2922_c1_g1_i2:178-480(-)
MEMAAAADADADAAVGVVGHLPTTAVPSSPPGHHVRAGGRPSRPRFGSRRPVLWAVGFPTVCPSSRRNRVAVDAAVDVPRTAAAAAAVAGGVVRPRRPVA